MFTKILLNIDSPLALADICSSALIKEYSANKRIKLSYWKVKNDVEEYLYSIIPEPLRESAELMCCSITGPGLAVPHIDFGVMSKINYYFGNDNSITNFHKLKNGDNNIIYPGEERGRIYNLDDLYTTGHFVANQYDAYILNVSEIHSVRILSRETRWMLTYSFSDVPYSELIKLLS